MYALGQCASALARSSLKVVCSPSIAGFGGPSPWNAAVKPLRPSREDLSNPKKGHTRSVNGDAQNLSDVCAKARTGEGRFKGRVEGSCRLRAKQSVRSLIKDLIKRTARTERADMSARHPKGARNMWAGSQPSKSDARNPEDTNPSINLTRN